MRFLRNDSFGFLCNFVFLNSAALSSIRKTLHNKFNIQIRLIRNTDLEFAKIFKKQFSSSLFFFLKLEDKLCLRTLQNVEVELKSLKLDTYSLVNGHSLFSFDYIFKSLKMYNFESWRFYNGLFIAKFLSKSIIFPLIGANMLLGTICYSKAWQQ